VEFLATSFALRESAGSRAEPGVSFVPRSMGSPGLLFLILRGPLTPSLAPLFWGVSGGGRGEGRVWGCEECESTKSHAVKVVASSM
jgi:hypothetical protein